MSSIFVFPDVPFLVVIKTTPFAPLEPYMAVASASFKISILSILSGLILLSGLASVGKPVVVVKEPIGSEA
ncbi:hypothetical protein D3C85_1859370 [compost metagenome]